VRRMRKATLEVHILPCNEPHMYAIYGFGCKCILSN
jgi:hypothetical protein